MKIGKNSLKSSFGSITMTFPKKLTLSLAIRIALIVLPASWAPVEADLFARKKYPNDHPASR